MRRCGLGKLLGSLHVCRQLRIWIVAIDELKTARSVSSRLMRANRFIRREPQTFVLLVRMGLWVGVFSCAARFLTLPRAMRLVSTSPRCNLNEDFDIARGYHYARTLDRLLSANRWCWTPTCWKRAAILHRFLALAGCDSRIIFGVLRDRDNLLAGHAWVEIDGQPAFESCPPRYTPTFSYP